MATRYVYEKWSSVKKYNTSPTETLFKNVVLDEDIEDMFTGGTIKFSSNYTADENGFSATGSNNWTLSPNGGSSATNPNNPDGYKYLTSSYNKDTMYELRISPSVTVSFGYSTSYYPSWYFTFIIYGREDLVLDSVKLYKYFLPSYYAKGTTKYSGYVTSSASSISATSSYFYDRIGTDNIDAKSISLSKTSVKIGEDVTITVSPSTSNTYGGTISYTYQYSTNGGSTWSTLKTTTLTSATVNVVSGTSFKARVVASDNYGFTSSTYTTSSAIPIITNTPPKFNVTGEDLGIKTAKFNIDYIVTDTEGNDVTIEEKLDNKLIRSFNPTLGENNTFSITDEEWIKVLNGNHSVTIKATDSQGANTINTWTFTKNTKEIEFTLKTPLTADAALTKTILNITRQIPESAIFKVEVCNNGYDEIPTWEDVTNAVLTQGKYFLTNTVKTATNWGYNVRVTVNRNSSIGDCYISGVGGNFE